MVEAGRRRGSDVGALRDEQDGCSLGEERRAALSVGAGGPTHTAIGTRECWIAFDEGGDVGGHHAVRVELDDHEAGAVPVWPGRGCAGPDDATGGSR